MTERSEILSSIATTMADYREGDLPAPTPDHVDRWVKQFDEGVQLPILREMRHVLGKTYFTRKGTREFLAGLVGTQKLVGDDPCAFWKSVTFLDIQAGGASQKEMLALFDAELVKKCAFHTKDCGKGGKTFVYLDDAMFTGNRVLRDLTDWVSDDAPSEATVHVIAVALHSGGQYYANGRLNTAAKAKNKKIDFTWWRAIELEDRKAYTNSSDVLRPVALPNDESVTAYVANMQYKPHLRVAGQVGGVGLYSSDAGRQLIEQEFLRAGVRIRNMCPNLAATQRPLGHMTLETLGFGSLIVTFRNCPNNAPLALWAGDPWYPLFPRTTNSDTSLKRFMAMLAKDSS
jgi:hypothetical protein